MVANFNKALNINKGDVVTLVGAGGKTSILKILAAEIKKNVIITTTTHIQSLKNFSENKIISENYGQISANIVKIRNENNHKIFITSKKVKELDNGKIKFKGISLDWVDRLHTEFEDEIIIVEGDGAAMKSIKAPAAYEPVVPKSSSKLITVIGLKDLGKEINSQNCHRVNKIKKLTSSSIIDKEMIIKIATDKKAYGYYRDKVDDYIVVLNQLGSCDFETALEIGEKIIELGIKKVILTDTNQYKPIIKILNRGDINERNK
ncbi:MAG: selenium cofactor biosynthesis protein YqeC [Bacillota bacterium]